MNRGKIALLALALVSTVLATLTFQISEAQTITPRPLRISSLTRASSSNPLGNYPRNQAGNAQNDNYGISLWSGTFPTP